ncbi:hypothetical protein HDE_01895 [Halotydeus destructor]|nr:hypothetical protein HDE_01895 [Halotydeus destructor]
MSSVILIEEVRRSVLEQCEQFEFDSRELDMIRQNESYVNLFIEDNNRNLDKTVAAILKALVYRKKYHLCDIEASLLNLDMYKWNAKVGRDICGKKILWVNYGCHRSIPELVENLLRVKFWFSSNLTEKYDTYANLQGLTFGAIDMRMSRKSASLMTSCFPGLVDHLYICGLPFGLAAIIQTMVKMVPARYVDKISFLSTEQAAARVSQLQGFDFPKASSIREVLLRDSVPEARIRTIIETSQRIKQLSDQIFDQLGI